MKTHLLIPLVAILLVTLACNVPNIAVGEPETTQPTTLEPGEVVDLLTESPPNPPGFTAIPNVTQLPGLNGTPSVPSVQAGTQDVNCRYGPDTAYLAVGALLKGYITPILGKSEDGTWWYIQDPRQPGIYCFVSRTVTDTVGDLSGIPSIPTPPTRVINVTVTVTLPTNPTPCLGGWPITAGFDGTIETNGPGLVTYRWELSQGPVSGNVNLSFTAFGGQKVTESQHIGAQGNYWVRLHVLSPNDITGQGDYIVPCTP